MSHWRSRLAHRVEQRMQQRRLARRRCRPLFEPLKARVMLATDFVLDASSESLEGFRLKLVNDGTDLRLLSLADGHEVKSQSLADSSGVVCITGSAS